MYRTTVLSIGLATAVLLAGCGDHGASFAPVAFAEAAPPSFLQVGKTYDLKDPNDDPVGSQLTIVEIDKDSGWVKVKYRLNARFPERTKWVNLATVGSITETEN